MKKFLTTALLVVGFQVAGIADIHSPPASEQTMLRKLYRGLSNIVYGSTELPNYWSRNVRSAGAVEGASYGALMGAHRTLWRFGYGVWEVVTFFEPAYKRSYKPPYQSVDFMPQSGYEEFPPQLGFLGQTSYTRTQVH
ncbi:MAG: exosortase system-associated protein, TIGR04073 family [Verrucomicrobiales bacterium]